MLNSRDDKIRTCDHTPPRRVLYRAELHPEYLDNILNNTKSVSGAVWYPIQCKIYAKSPDL